MKKHLIQWMLALFVAALAAGGCSKDETGGGSSGGQTTQPVETPVFSLAQQIKRMEASIASMQTLQSAAGKLSAQLGTAANLAPMVDALKAQLQSMQTAAAGKVDVEVYLHCVEETNSQMQSGCIVLAELKAQLNDLAKRSAGDAALVKSVDEALAALDAAAGDLTAMLDDAVLKRVYAAFIDEYAALRTRLLEQQRTSEAKIAANTSRLEGLDDEVAANAQQIAANEKKIAELQSILDMLEGEGGDIGDAVTIAKNIAELQTQTADLKAEQAALIQNMEAIEANLKQQIEQLEKNQLTLDEVDALFETKAGELLAGLDEQIEQALAESLGEALAPGGSISTAISAAISAAIAEEIEDRMGSFAADLQQLDGRIDALEQAVAELEQQLDALEGRVGKSEEQIADLLRRIQSLVYVPKTSDGMIHVGTTYIAAVGEDGSESGSRIELTPTKKVEYRVSPADLAGEIVALWAKDNSILSFYQEHVSPLSRAEGQGMDEFHIRNVEMGNGPGEMLLTVEHDHDFTHENLAVALCVKYTAAKSGVTTEFTSPYTTVVGDGRNVITRFYMARKTDTGYEAVRGDDLAYLLPYSNSKQVNLIDRNHYEMVYDNGESVMSFADAKERFEWDASLGWSIKGIDQAFKSDFGSSAGSYFSVTPSDPNSSRSSTVALSLKTSAGANSLIGHTISDAYQVTLTSGDLSVVVLDRLDVTVHICDNSYTLEGSSTFVWNYNKWEGGIGRAEGDRNPYVSSELRSIAAVNSTSRKYTSLDEQAIRSLLDTSEPWTMTNLPATATFKGDLKITNAPLTYASNWQTSFTVDGYLYSENTASGDNNTTVTLTRTAKPAHLLGDEGISLKAEHVTFDAPPVQTVKIDATARMGTVSGALKLFYVTVSDKITATDKKLNYGSGDVEKYFGGNTSNLSMQEFLSSYSLTFDSWSSSDGHTLPMVITLMSPATGDAGSGAALYPTLGAMLSQIKGGTITSDTVFTPPTGAAIEITDGPSFRISSDSKITVQPAQ